MKLCLICNFQTAEEQEVCPRDGSSMVTVGDDPLLGLVVEGRYKIESVIGQGSAGTVYKAIQELINREVAIKVLHDYLVSDDEFIKRFTQEAKASSRLSHPNIITIYDFGVIPKGGRPYIAMDLLRGTPLSDLLAERNHLSADDAIPVFKQVCSALGEAHRQGVVHRDVKPENIVLVERSGQRYFPIVVDFGIARLVQDESEQAKITRTGTVCGSPTYMSPEQCTSSKVDHRSDIYSLGVVIFETLTGEVPFMSDELVKVMAMHLSDPPKPLNQVREDLQFPPALEEVVYRALAKSPDARYQSMDEFAEALDEAYKQPVSVQTATGSHQIVSRDVTPGPLASSDDFAPHRENRDMVKPNVKPRDLASRALEELAQRTSGAYQMPEEERKAVVEAALEKAAERGTIPVEKASLSTFQSTRKKPSAGAALGNLFHNAILPAIVAAAFVGLIFYAANNPAMQRYIPWKSATLAEADSLYSQHKYEEALPVYQTLKEQGKLAKDKAENMYKAMVYIAQQLSKEGHYNDAVNLLQQVPSESKQYSTAKTLLKTYKKKLAQEK